MNVTPAVVSGAKTRALRTLAGQPSELVVAASAFSYSFDGAQLRPEDYCARWKEVAVVDAGGAAVRGPP